MRAMLILDKARSLDRMISASIRQRVPEHLRRGGRPYAPPAMATPAYPSDALRWWAWSLRAWERSVVQTQPIGPAEVREAEVAVTRAAVPSMRPALSGW